VFNDLKSAGADLNIVDEESNSLYHYAIKMNCEALFNILIDANVDSNKINNAGHSTLLYAFLYNRVNMIPILISKCNDLTFKENHTQKSYLHYAVQCQNFEIVKQLIEAQPQLLHSIDDSQKTVIHYVVENFSKEDAHTYLDYFLTKSSGDVLFNVQDNVGNTPLHTAVQKHMIRNSCGCVIKKLVENQANLYIKNRLGVMPIEMGSMSKSFISELC
jgi:ankyrin repeat protein